MAEKAVGFIILSVNGQEYDCATLNPTKIRVNVRSQP